MEFVHISRDLFTRIRAFFRTMDGVCKSCFRGVPVACKECDAGRGAALGRAMDREVAPKANPFKTLTAEVAHHIRIALETADGPLSSKQIVVPDCSSQMKEFVLRKLVRQGFVARIRTSRHRYVYCLKHR